jgi:hypothetical protein
MTTTTKKHTSLAFFNDNTKKAFRSLLRELKRQGLIVYQVNDIEDNELHVTDDTDVLDIMDHSFATEFYRLYVTYKDTYGVIVGHLDGCTESMFADWGYPKTDYKTRSYTEIDQKIETACDNFNNINQDLELL